MPAPDEGALTEPQGVNAGSEQGEQTTSLGNEGRHDAEPPEVKAEAGAERVEPDGTTEGGLLSRTNQHDGGPGQEYAAGEGG